MCKELEGWEVDVGGEMTLHFDRSFRVFRKFQKFALLASSRVKSIKSTKYGNCGYLVGQIWKSVDLIRLV